MIKFILPGQLKSGKNGMQVSRYGAHYPKKEWAEWRDRVVLEILDKVFERDINEPCRIRVRYFAGDKRRRDVPGMLDALYHCFERARVVTDDKWLMNVEWISDYDKDKPRTEIEIELRNPRA